MKNLEADIFENINLNTGEIVYELWLHDYANLGSQLVDVAIDFSEKTKLTELAKKINNVFIQGGY